MTQPIRTRLAAVSLGVALSLAAATMAAQTGPSIKFTETKLGQRPPRDPSEDHTAPVYSSSCTYNVGSRDERTGRTGFAHLFEHMMFKGSRTSAPVSTSCWSSATAAP